MFVDYRVLFVVFCLLSLAGCGRSGPEVVSVEGRVTYGGGPWPKKGMIYFVPASVEAGVPARSGAATFDTDGSFRVTSYQSGDGLVPGHYRVSLECWEKPPSMITPAPVNYVPTKYHSALSSGLEATIPSGQRRVEVNFDVPKN